MKAKDCLVAGGWLFAILAAGCGRDEFDSSAPDRNAQVECTRAGDCAGAASCEVAACTDGACVYAPAPAGRACGSGGGVCDGARACVECLGADECESAVCEADVCVPAECADGVQNGDETDVDCGGTCAPCAIDGGCSTGADCSSGVCTDGACSAPTCRDGVANGGETGVDCGGPCAGCDNGNPCTAGGDCAFSFCDDGTCAYAVSCLELLSGGAVGDGDYTVDLDEGGPMAPLVVFCDMTTHGGGWTEVTIDMAFGDLGGIMIAVDPAVAWGFDSQHRPCTVDGLSSHTYHYTFQFPPGFEEFFLEAYETRANSEGAAASEILPGSFVQGSWLVANADPGGNGNPNGGDVSFGSADDAGPTTSYAAENGAAGCNNCAAPWPAGRQAFAVGAASTSFRIGWGETGLESEGWCPWWAGTVRLR